MRPAQRSPGTPPPLRLCAFEQTHPRPACSRLKRLAWGCFVWPPVMGPVRQGVRRVAHLFVTGNADGAVHILDVLSQGITPPLRCRPTQQAHTSQETGQPQSRAGQAGQATSGSG